MKVRNKFTFPANNLNITSVDIQSVEPVDQRTRDALQKSVQLAIEITTASQEAAARFVYILVFYWMNRKCLASAVSAFSLKLFSFKLCLHGEQISLHSQKKGGFWSTL